MKLLTVIIHEQARESFVELLNSQKEILSWTITPCEGHAFGNQANPFETARDLVLGYVPRLKFEILLPEQVLEVVIDRISLCRSCIEGTGLWYYTDIKETGTF